MADHNSSRVNRNDDFSGPKRDDPNLFSGIMTVSCGLLVAEKRDGHGAVSFEPVGVIAHEIPGGSEDGNYGNDKIQIIHQNVST